MSEWVSVENRLPEMDGDECTKVVLMWLVLMERQVDSFSTQ